MNNIQQKITEAQERDNVKRLLDGLGAVMPVVAANMQQSANPIHGATWQLVLFALQDLGRTAQARFEQLSGGIVLVDRIPPDAKVG